MKTNLIALAAASAIVAILAIPHRGNPGMVNDTARIIGGPSNSRQAASNAEVQKSRVTPVQAQAYVVGLALVR